MTLRAEMDADGLLALWERTLGPSGGVRDDLLLQGEPPARTLGGRNTRLLALHTRWFGAELALLSHCPACAGVVEFAADGERLMAQMAAGDDGAAHCVELLGHQVEFRLPGADDVAAAAAAEDDDTFAQAVLERCVLGCTHDGAPLAVKQLPAPLCEAISQQMEALDPAASLSFAVECPDCATQWDARLDLGQLVSQKLQAAAERLLLDVDALARAYGWTEAEVLALSPVRRAAYLQMAA